MNHNGRPLGLKSAKGLSCSYGNGRELAAGGKAHTTGDRPPPRVMVCLNFVRKTKNAEESNDHIAREQHVSYYGVNRGGDSYRL